MTYEEEQKKFTARNPSMTDADFARVAEAAYTYMFDLSQRSGPVAMAMRLATGGPFKKLSTWAQLNENQRQGFKFAALAILIGVEKVSGILEAK